MKWVSSGVEEINNLAGICCQGLHQQYVNLSFVVEDFGWIIRFHERFEMNGLVAICI